MMGYGYLCYLLEIFNNRSNDFILRQLAGICIKNYLENIANYQINQEFLKEFKIYGLASLNDENPTIRNTLSYIISSFTKIDGVRHWDDLPEILSRNLYTNNPHVFQNFLETVDNIIEDSGEILMKTTQGTIVFITNQQFI